jgi:WD40 repeat protein
VLSGGAKGWVYAVALSGDGTTLAGAGVGTEVKLWHLPTGQERRRVQAAPLGNDVSCLALSSDGKLLATGSSDSNVKLWWVATGKEKAVLHGHPSSVWSLAFSGDGKTLASGGDWDDALRLWDVETGRQRAGLSGHAGGVRAVVFGGDNTALTSSQNRGVDPVRCSIRQALTDSCKSPAAGIKSSSGL